MLAARFFASGKIKEMSDTVHTSILFAAISGVVMMIVGLLFSRFALELMETPDEVIDMAALYLKIYFVGVPFFMLYNYGAAVLRAVGDTRRPLVFLVISGAVNAILNMVLVILFHLDVEGVAIATVISQMISCVLVLRCLCKTDACYQLHFSKLSINGKYLRQIFQVGVPAGIQSTVINFSNVPCSHPSTHLAQCDGRLYGSQQFAWIFIYLNQFCYTGVHELYQPELRS